MPPPRPASGDMIYTIHAYGLVTNSMSMLAFQYSQPKEPGDLDLWTLKVVSESRVDVVYLCANFILPWPLLLDLGLMYATDRRHTASSLNVPVRGHNKYGQNRLRMYSTVSLN